MSNLQGTYELSLWQDILQEDGSFLEQRLMVIGSSEMLTQSKALEPKLTENINGSHNLNFKMYYQYEDNITGEKVNNLFCKYIANESKLKLYYKNKWYDFIVKAISENSADYSFTYSAIDYHINELSKNGFGLTLDTELENNIGTVEELGRKILVDTDWDVEAEKIPQMLEEALIEIRFGEEQTITNAIRLDNEQEISPEETVVDNLVIPAGSMVYMFYSCLKDESKRLSFIYTDKPLEVDSNRVILNTNCQYYIDDVQYAVDDNYAKFGLKKPAESFMDNESTVLIGISSNYRGKRYVFSRKVIYNSILDKYVTEFTQDIGENKKTWHMYEETKYDAPILIQNLVTNNSFNNTTGWTGQYLSNSIDPNIEEPAASVPNKQSIYGTEVKALTNPDITEALIDGTYNPEASYKPYLCINFKEQINNTQGVLINSGFYDNRKNISNLNPGQQFVLLYKLSDLGGLNTFKVEVGVKKYLTSANCYLSDYKSNNTYITFETSEASDFVRENYSGYKYIIGNVVDNYNLTEIEYLSKKIQIFITPSTHGVLNLEDFQIFPYIDNGSGSFMLPGDAPTEAKTSIQYCYFDPNSEINKKATNISGMNIIKRSNIMEGLNDSYIIGAEKTVTLSIKQSNYFNAIHSLCEIAECWPDFQITHNDNGEILSKKVVFRNYIGQKNYVGFKYGLNLKQITRQINSNNIVTKLIVPQNTNEYAKDGFCTIARAGSNETGEAYLYDFSHYINLGMLDRVNFTTTIYDTTNAIGLDMIEDEEERKNFDTQNTNHYGYYTRLSQINKKLEEINDAIITYSQPLSQARADVKTNEAGRLSAEEEFKTAAASFLQLAGFEYTNIVVEGNPEETERRQALISEGGNDNIIDYFQKVITYQQSYIDFSAKESVARLSLETYEEENQNLINAREELIEQKRLLNLAFYKKYNRFIQEGTWKDDAAIDNEKYYINAQSVAYTSSKPQVTYTINVIELSKLPGYENITFQLADQTWIEDEEFFGFDENGYPIREEIVLTEIIYNLDNDSQTSVKVQNFKNQFQDLFQRITAQVQSVSYSSGSWKNAATFVEADAEEQSKFLQDALNSADLVINNKGNQSVEYGDEGIIVTDLSNPNQKLRLTAGAILLSDTNDGGEQFWKVGMTARGINAQNITAGTINTDNLQIMGGSEPYFRWDKYGITAYDFTINQYGGLESISNYNTSRGVRFDRFGLYGFSNTAEVDGAKWHPETLDDIKDKAQFALTWEGMFLKPGNGIYNQYYTYIKNSEEEKFSEVSTLANSIKHTNNVIFGRADNKIYNSWVTTPGDFYGLPYFDTAKDTGYFTKIFSIANKTGSEQLVIYDDGTLVANNIKLNGSIQWTSASSPSKSVYASSTYINNKAVFPSIEDSLEKIGSYASVPEEDPGDGSWHKIATVNDSYYAHTDNGGSTWEGPFLITGKSIKDTEITYGTALAGTEPGKVEYNKNTRPALNTVKIGHNIYTKIVDKFNDGTESDPRYSIDSGRTAMIYLSRYSSSILTSENGEYDSNLLKNLSTVTVTVKDGDNDVSTDKDLSFYWTVTDGTFNTTSSGAQIPLGEPSTIREVSLSSMTADSAAIKVEVKMGTMSFGEKTFIISKSKQGESGVVSYISSSAGTAFEEKELKDANGNDLTTKLTAHLLKAGWEEIDSDGNKFIYKWFREQGSLDSEITSFVSYDKNKKEVTLKISELKGVTLYFTAEEKTVQQ